MLSDRLSRRNRERRAMAIFPLTITVWNIQPGSSVSVVFTSGSMWSVMGVPGFAVTGDPAGQLGLTSVSLGPVELAFTVGPSPSGGTLIFGLHVDTAEGGTSVSGYLDTGEDMEVILTYATASGVVGALTTDWTIALE
jgi:hypothetical protein